MSHITGTLASFIIIYCMEEGLCWISKSQHFKGRLLKLVWIQYFWQECTSLPIRACARFAAVVSIRSVGVRRTVTCVLKTTTAPWVKYCIYCWLVPLGMSWHQNCTSKVSMFLKEASSAFWGCICLIINRVKAVKFWTIITI